MRRLARCTSRRSLRKTIGPKARLQSSPFEKRRVVAYLADQHGDPLGGKETHAAAVSVKVTRGESLVGGIEECIVAFLQEQLGEGLPLLRRRVDTL